MLLTTKPMILKFTANKNHLQNILKDRFLGATPKDSDLVGLGMFL